MGLRTSEYTRVVTGDAVVEDNDELTRFLLSGLGRLETYQISSRQFVQGEIKTNMAAFSLLQRVQN